MSLPNSSITSMLIRKSVSTVYRAFIDPDVTTKFWFTHSSSALTLDTSLTWSWSMYNLDVPVTVIEIVEDELIIISWGENEYKSRVKFEFKSLGEDKTYVTITNDDFQVAGEAMIDRIIDATGGFTMVMAGLQAWLEHGIQLNLIADKAPKELQKL